MKRTTLIASALTIALSSGCSSIPKLEDFIPPPPVKVITEEIPIEIYQPPLPEQITLQDVNWFVITKENWEESVVKVEELLDGDFVVFGITPLDYESMAYNLQEMRRFIRQQKEIILYYREATAVADEKEEWLEKNEELQTSDEGE